MNNAFARLQGRTAPPAKEPLLSLLIYWLVVPLTCALIIGASSTGEGRFSARWAYFAYPMVGALPKWVMAWAMTWLVCIVLRPWRPNLLVVTTIGVLLANHVSAPWATLVQHLFQPWLRPGVHFYAILPWRYNDPSYVVEAAVAWVSAAFIWGATNAFWVYFLGYPRFGFKRAESVEPPEPSEASAPSGALGAIAPFDILDNPLASRLPVDIAADIIALQAEQHYTRVHSRAANALVLIRFSDAVRAMNPGDGLQVHRSFWVRPNAIRSASRSNDACVLEMVNGLKVPVGRSFKREADAAGVGAMATRSDEGVTAGARANDC